MRSFCCALNIAAIPFCQGPTVYEVHDRQEVAADAAKTTRPAQGPAAKTELQQSSVRMARSPARVNAPAPGGLPQAHQPLRCCLGFGAAGGRAGAILEIRYTRYQGLLAEEPAECTGAPIQFQVSERICYVAGVTEGNDPSGHRVTDLINAGANGRLNMLAALRIGKAFPSTPSLDHKISLSITKKGGPRTRTTN